MKEPRTHRRLAERPLQGRFAITEAALDAAEALLPTFRGPDGNHEGIVLLAGYEQDDLTLFCAAIAPEADHGPGRVHCRREHVLAAARAARAPGLAILAQLHSHPGPLTYHSLGDDDMVLMPFQGMLSLVAPHYGHYGLRPLDGLGIHQFQSGRWVLCERATIRTGFAIVPTRIDLR